MTKIALLLASLLIGSSAYSQTTNGEVNPKIYGMDTVIWFGADFSLFRLSNARKMGKEEKLQEYIFAWNVEYKNSISNVKLKSWFNAKKVVNDKAFTDDAYVSFIPEQWIVAERHKITRAQIESHVKKVTTENTGLGLIYLIENMYKGAPVGVPSNDPPSTVHGYFVWFDIASRDIIHIYESGGRPSTSPYSVSGQWTIMNKKKMPKNKGMTGYWFQGMVDATVKFSIDYKNGIEKEETQY